MIRNEEVIELEKFRLRRYFKNHIFLISIEL